MSDAREVIRRLSKTDGRFRPEAFVFVFESLEPAIALAGKKGAEGQDRHLTGQELLEGMRQQARKLFGPLAAHVWRSWGVRSSLDWGHVVFLLVESGLLNRREEDSIEDFREGFDFDEFFVEDYTFELPTEIGPLPDAGGSGS
jgi:uncharacterized repeat protein (TIGR04138 family)